METIDIKKYDGMGIFQEAKQREIDGYGYHATRCKVLWNGKKASWQHIIVIWGIRFSERWQLFPIWNTSNNSNRSLSFGIWKLFLQISYSRAKSCNYLFKMPFFRQLRKVYLLCC
ncbi:MAG: hypothetical protein WC389_16395 [Lutibacter sp.]